MFYTCWESEKSCGCLWAAHTILRHALVHAIVLRPDVEHTQHLWGHPMARRRAQGLSVVEPHHSGSGLAPHLTAETHRVAPCNVLLLRLDTHLGRLWKTKEGNFRKMSQNTRKKMHLDGLAAQNTSAVCDGTLLQRSLGWTGFSHPLQKLDGWMLVNQLKLIRATARAA